MDCACLQVSAEEQKHVLGRRKGNTLSRRSIMKSYKPANSADQNVLQLDGVADIRKVSTLPIYTAGSCTVQVMGQLLPTPASKHIVQVASMT